MGWEWVRSSRSLCCAQRRNRAVRVIFWKRIFRVRGGPKATSPGGMVIPIWDWMSEGSSFGLGSQI